MEIESETIETPAGDYTVDWIVDECPERPYNYGFGLVSDGRRDSGYDARIDIAEDDEGDAAEILELVQQCGSRISGAGLARYVRLKYKLGAVVVIDENFRAQEPSTDAGERIYGLAWGDSEWDDPQEAVKNCLAEWHAWAEGDCFGWELLDPRGKLVDSCWGYFGFDRERDYTLQTATQVALSDAEDRVEQANLVGAGFVGLV